MSRYKDLDNEYLEQFKRVNSFLHRYVTSIIHDEIEAEDLVQEACIKGLYGYPDYDSSKGKFKTWICSITKRTVIDYLRKKRRRISTFVPEDDFSNVIDDSPQGEEVALERETYRIYNHAIEGINPTYLNTIEFRVQGCSYLETAKKLKVQPGTVLARIHRARKQIKDRLKSTGYFDSEFLSADN